MARKIAVQFPPTPAGNALRKFLTDVAYDRLGPDGSRHSVKTERYVYEEGSYQNRLMYRKDQDGTTYAGNYSDQLNDEQVQRMPKELAEHLCEILNIEIESAPDYPGMLGGYDVKLSEDGKLVKVGCTTVTRDQVWQILRALEKRAGKE